MDISYKIKIIDSFRFMSCSLSSLVDNLAADKIKNIFSYECEGCNNRLDLKIMICYSNVFNVIHGTKNSLNIILLINLKYI